MHYLEFLNNAFYPIWKAVILLIIPQPLPSLSTGLTLCYFFHGSKVNYFTEDTVLQHFWPSHGLSYVSEFLIYDIHGQQIQHLHAPVSCTPYVLGYWLFWCLQIWVLAPEVLRTCLLCPLQVAWHSSYQSVFVLCCCLWHASSLWQNVCLPQHTWSLYHNLSWKVLPEVICTNPLLKAERVISHHLLACSPQHPNSVNKFIQSPSNDKWLWHLFALFSHLQQISSKSQLDWQLKCWLVR